MMVIFWFMVIFSMFTANINRKENQYQKGIVSI